MRFCIPRVVGRGAGLGNELLPWAKAYIASEELGIKLLPPAWGLNDRKYWTYFDSSRLDWLVHRALSTVLPTYTFTEADYREAGGHDLALAIRNFSARHDLATKPAYVLFMEGMWGGYESVHRARDFIWSSLHSTQYTQRNLYDLRSRLEDSKLSVAVHIRLGDFRPAAADVDYRGNFSASLPLAWYANSCRAIRAAFANEVEFVLFSDGNAPALKEFIDEFNPVTTFHQTNTACSDLLAMANADLLICSVSSYSMWSAFLSGRPYLWFRPQLQAHAGFHSLWGHESAQQSPEGLTASNLLASSSLAETMGPRGVPIGADGQLPDFLVTRLADILTSKQSRTDLIRYGVVRQVP